MSSKCLWFFDGPKYLFCSFYLLPALVQASRSAAEDYEIPNCCIRSCPTTFSRDTLAISLAVVLVYYRFFRLCPANVDILKHDGNGPQVSTSLRHFPVYLNYPYKCCPEGHQHCWDISHCDSVIFRPVEPLDRFPREFKHKKGYLPFVFL